MPAAVSSLKNTAGVARADVATPQSAEDKIRCDRNLRTNLNLLEVRDELFDDILANPASIGEILSNVT
jgi:hypothetical protein